jgi:membrane protein YdbS with pleckstrin-like domain
MKTSLMEHNKGNGMALLAPWFFSFAKGSMTNEFTPLVNQERFIPFFRVQHLLPLQMIKGPLGFGPDQVQVIAVGYQSRNYIGIQRDVLD